MGVEQRPREVELSSSRGCCVQLSTVNSQHALIQVDLDSPNNSHLLLQQGGTEHYEFQECTSNISGCQRVAISADFGFGVKCSLFTCCERCCLLRFICGVQWLLWPPNGLDHAEAGPNCSGCSCSNLGVPSRWISCAHCLPQESHRQRQCLCLLLLIGSSLNCCFHPTNHHY